MFNIGKIRSSVAYISASIALASCVSYPASTIDQGGTSSAIYFEAFPPEATVVVDGQAVGTVFEFNGVDQTLAVSPGTHVVKVIQGRDVLHDRKVFVGRDSALKISR